MVVHSRSARRLMLVLVLNSLLFEFATAVQYSLCFVFPLDDVASRRPSSKCIDTRAPVDAWSVILQRVNPIAITAATTLAARSLCALPFFIRPMIFDVCDGRCSIFGKACGTIQNMRQYTREPALPCVQDDRLMVCISPFLPCSISKLYTR